MSHVPEDTYRDVQKGEMVLVMDIRPYNKVSYVVAGIYAFRWMAIEVSIQFHN